MPPSNATVPPLPRKVMLRYWRCPARPGFRPSFPRAGAAAAWASPRPRARRTRPKPPLRRRPRRRREPLRHRRRDAQAEQAQAVLERRSRVVHHLARHARRTRLLGDLEELAEHLALGRERRGVLRRLAAHRHQHEVAAERLPPAREPRARDGPAFAAEARPVLVVGRRILLRHLEQRLGVTGQADHGVRVEPARLEREPERRSQRLGGGVQPLGGDGSARGGGEAAGIGQHERGPEAGREQRVERPGGRRERLGDEAELDGVGGRLEAAARPGPRWARPGTRSSTARVASPGPSRGTTICSESLLAAITSAGTPPTRTSLRAGVVSKPRAGHAHHVAR